LQLALFDSVGARFLECVRAPALREAGGLPRLRKIIERWCEWVQAPKALVLVGRQQHHIIAPVTRYDHRLSATDYVDYAFYENWR
jgi:hypothetical protein